MNLPTEYLADKWHTLLTACRVEDEQASPHYINLLKAYDEPHRAYHNLAHIEHFLLELDEALLVEPAAQWACWYHDVIYQPGANNNEMRSAQMAMQTLKLLGLDDVLCSRVFELIEATKMHQCAPNDLEQGLFLDADMAILGAPADQYTNYARGVRVEYGNVPEVLYKMGRKRFLKKILARDRIFLTEQFRQRYEQIARHNILTELKAGI